MSTVAIATAAIVTKCDVSPCEYHNEFSCYYVYRNEIVAPCIRIKRNRIEAVSCMYMYHGVNWPTAIITNVPERPTL